MLEATGLITLVAFSEAKVTKLDGGALDELMVMSESLEALALRINWDSPSEINLDRAKQFVRIGASASSIHELIDADREFHLAVIGATDHRYMQSEISAIWDMTFYSRRISLMLDSTRIETMEQEHESIIAVLEKPDINMAEALLRSHIKSCRESLLEFAE